MSHVVTRWWLIRHAPVIGAAGRIYGQDDLDCDCSNGDVFADVAAQLPADPGIIAGRVGSLTVWGSVPAPGGSGAVTVPAGALTMIGADEVVFVATPKGYQRRTVHRLGAGDGQVVLKDGVRAGEAVVVSGTSALKALAEAN